MQCYCPIFILISSLLAICFKPITNCQETKKPQASIYLNTKVHTFHSVNPQLPPIKLKLDSNSEQLSNQMKITRTCTLFKFDFLKRSQGYRNA